MFEPKKWGQIVELRYGKALSGYRDDPDATVPVYGTNGPVGFTRTPQVNRPGVIVGRKGAYRGVHYSATPFSVIDTAFYVDSGPEVYDRWAFYALQLADINGLDSGSAIPSTTREAFYSLPLLLPPFPAQKAIVDVLGALDDKIAANSKLAATSDELISLRFRQAIASGGAESRRLFDVIDIDFGEPFKGHDFSEPGTGRPLIRIRDLKTFTSQVWTTESRPKEVLVQPGDVVVGMDAEFRPTSWLGEPGLLNQRVCRARGKATGQAFVRESLKEPLSRIEGYKTATTVIHLNKKDLQETDICVPDTKSLRLFESSVEGLYSQRVAVALENRTLAAIRDALLPQLMSGMLRVKDAENVLEDAGV